MRDVAIGLAGAGYWGSKLARNIFEAQNCRLAAVSDPDPETLKAAIGRYPGTRGLSSFEELVADPEVEGVVVATPASMHAEHARMALRAGKHAMIEKPLALSVAEADELCALAEETGLKLMVGHTFLYSEPVRFLRQLIVSGELGQVLYIYAQRLNLGIIRSDLNAMWNFGPHDISILLYLVGEDPDRVSARQFTVLDHSLADMAFVVLEFPGGVIGHIHESWLDPRKVRQITVVGDEKMVVYDDTDVEAPISIYDKGVTRSPMDPESPPDSAGGFGEFKLAVRAGDVVMPRVMGREPLGVEIEHFAECIAEGTTPLSDVEQGREVVAVLEAAERSTASGGAAVDVERRVREHSAS
jgi:predicted dehydrogenase